MPNRFSLSEFQFGLLRIEAREWTFFSFCTFSSGQIIKSCICNHEKMLGMRVCVWCDAPIMNVIGVKETEKAGAGIRLLLLKAPRRHNQTGLLINQPGSMLGIL